MIFLLLEISMVTWSNMVIWGIHGLFVFFGMLLATLGTTWLGNIFCGLTVKDVIRADEVINRAEKDFQSRLILWLMLKYKGFVKININLMVIPQEAKYLL